MLNENRVLPILLVVASLTWLMSSDGFAQSMSPKKVLSADEIIALIPKSSDGLTSPDEVKRYLEIVAMGEKIYPALCAELLKTDDVYLAGRIIGILLESQGDKTLPRKTIIAVLSKWKAQSNEASDMRCIIAMSLARIGTKDDAPVLLPLLNDSASAVRVNSLRSLSKIGDEQTAEQVQAWVMARKASLTEAQQLKDPSIREAEKTTAAIRERVKKRAVNQ